MRIREGGIDVTLVKLPARQQVALVVDARRAVPERRLGVGDDRQLFVVDVDQLRRRECGVLGLRSHDRDRLAVVANDAVGEHVCPRLERADLECLTGDVDPDGVPGHVLRGENRSDPGSRLGRGGVHAEQAGVRHV